MEEKPLIYYFGCIGDKGHFLWCPREGRLLRSERPGQPWGDRIDGVVFPGGHPGGKGGVVHVARKDGWMAVGWADYSVDTRGGSHSTFLVQAEMPVEDLIAAARVVWPKVFGRPGFPALSMT